MIQPCFIYGAGPTTFTPTYPPTGKQPVDAMSAVSHQSITSDGSSMQTVLERIDLLNSLDFKNVPASDLASWVTFLTFAMTGQAFKYCPDSTQPGTFTNYQLVTTDWSPQWQYINMFSFSLQMRKV